MKNYDNSIQAVIFDLGGVLLRTEDHSPRTELAARFGMTYGEIGDLVFYDQSAKEATLGLISAEAHWEVVCRALKLPADQVENVRRDFFAGDHLDDNLVNYIRHLRPRIKTALLSNAWDDLHPMIVEHWRIEDVFDALIISADVKLAKPDPRIFEMALSRLDVPAQRAVFIDDVIENLQAARSLGLHTIQFLNSTQTLSELETLINQKN